MNSMFTILVEPHRRQILDLLVEADRSVGELVDQLDLAQPSVSKHLRTLREAGLVAARVDGQRRIYRLEPTPLKAIDDWLGPYRRRWADALDALDRHLDEMDEPTDPKEPT